MILAKTIFQILIKLLIKYEWDQIYSNNYQNTFSNFPMNPTKIKYKNRLPYIISGLRISIQYKHILRHIYAKNPTDENYQKCRTLNNKLTSLLRKREQDYMEKHLDLNQVDMSKSWKVIKDIIKEVNIHITHSSLLLIAIQHLTNM